MAERRSFVSPWVTLGEIQKADFDNDVMQEVYSTSNMKRTWEVRYACTNNVHLRFLLPQVTPHLLGSESPLFEPSLKEVVHDHDEYATSA
ncbi:MAG TPA: hypothetical protein IAA29_18465 [Candidatus Paenibacillus intestinavium]|nr:hypothetical protein [Candidatus Paenibacillus intestinavium]